MAEFLTIRRLTVQFRPTKQLLVAFMAPPLVWMSLAGTTARAQDSDAKVHVYPGAQPIDAQPAEPAQTAPATEPAGKGEEAASQTNPGDNEGKSSADAEQVESSLDKAEKAEEEKTAQAETAAAQHYALGAHYFSKWDLDLAELEFDETVSICPDLKIAHRDLCLISFLKLNLSRSLAEFMMVTGITDPLAYNAKDKSDLDAKAARLHYRKALFWGKKYEWPESITELLWAQTYAPNNPAIHHSLAFAYASSGDFQKAEDEYKLTFAESPQDADAHADFANLLLDKGQATLAETEMRKAVELSPNAAALHVDLGWIAEAHQDYATAEKEFQAAVKLSPSHAGLWTHLGRLLEHQGQVAEAQQAYSRAITLDSTCEDARNSLERLKQQKPSA